MRIKNVGSCKIVFNGGVLEPSKVAIFKDSAEKIGAVLLKMYPKNLLNLDHVKEEDVVEVVVAPEVEAEEPAKEEVKKVAKKK